jgi:hypothetical protein
MFDSEARIKNLPYPERLLRAGRRQLYYSLHVGEEKAVDLIALQRMYLHHLEARLLTGINKIVETMDIGKSKLLSNAAEMEEPMAELGCHLHEYC